MLEASEGVGGSPRRVSRALRLYQLYRIRFACIPLADVEIALVIRAHIVAVMEELCLPRRTLNEKMAKYNLQRADYV